MSRSRRRASNNEKAGVAGLIGGILMIIAGVTGAATWRNIGELAVTITGIDGIGLIFQVLVLLGSLGGLLVILGSFVIGWKLFRMKTTDRVKTGKLMITIGAGFGLLGLLIFILLTALGEDPLKNFMGAVGIGFIGLILSIVARQKAR